MALGVGQLMRQHSAEGVWRECLGVVRRQVDGGAHEAREERAGQSGAGKEARRARREGGQRVKGRAVGEGGSAAVQLGQLPLADAEPEQEQRGSGGPKQE